LKVQPNSLPSIPLRLCVFVYRGITLSIWPASCCFGFYWFYLCFCRSNYCTWVFGSCSTELYPHQFSSSRFCDFDCCSFYVLSLSLSRIVPPGFPVSVLTRTMKMSVSSLITLFILVTTAMIMNDSGMTTILALGVSRAAGPVYPLLAPFFGLLGTFLTGSNTNSNLLFGLFQHQAALNLGLAPALLVAAHTAAASIASSIAPAKIILATSAIGNHGEEQALLARTLPYCLFLTIVAGLAAIVLALLYV
jgi:hypothetical protein